MPFQLIKYLSIFLLLSSSVLSWTVSETAIKSQYNPKKPPSGTTVNFSFLKKYKIFAEIPSYTEEQMNDLFNIMTTAYAIKGGCTYNCPDVGPHRPACKYYPSRRIPWNIIDDMCLFRADVSALMFYIHGKSRPRDYNKSYSYRHLKWSIPKDDTHVVNPEIISRQESPSKGVFGSDKKPFAFPVDLSTDLPFIPAKIFIFPNNKKQEEESITVKVRGKEVEWNFHVALIVESNPITDPPTFYVLDPAVRKTGPMLLKEWLDRATGFRLVAICGGLANGVHEECQVRETKENIEKLVDKLNVCLNERVSSTEHVIKDMWRITQQPCDKPNCVQDSPVTGPTAPKPNSGGKTLPIEDSTSHSEIKKDEKTGETGLNL